MTRQRTEGLGACELMRSKSQAVEDDTAPAGYPVSGDVRHRERERVPLNWARSFGHEGVTLMLLAERRRDAAMAKTALSQINAAFETMRDSGNAQGAAYFEQKLSRARAIVARLSGR